MSAVASVGCTRRAALATGLIALTAGLTTTAPVAARPLLRTGFGIVGGGVVQTPDGEAHFSLFASEMAIVDDDGTETGSVLGHLQWVDPAWHGEGLTLESVEITGYTHIPGPQPHINEVRGRVSFNGAGRYPFLLRAADAGPAGSGQDTLSLLVGFPEADEQATPSMTAGLAYAVDTTLVAGNIAEVKFNAPTGS